MTNQEIIECLAWHLDGLKVQQEGCKYTNCSAHNGRTAKPDRCKACGLSQKTALPNYLENWHLIVEKLHERGLAVNIWPLMGNGFNQVIIWHFDCDCDVKCKCKNQIVVNGKYTIGEALGRATVEYFKEQGGD